MNAPVPETQETIGREIEDSDERQARQDLTKDVSASLVWSFQALLAVAAFSVLSTASHSDWELLIQAPATTENGIKLPMIGVSLGLTGFLIVTPVILIAIQVYVHIQTACLLDHGLKCGDRANSLIQNHVACWPASLLGFVSFVAPPATIAYILWKVSARHAANEAPLLFGQVHANTFTLLIGFLFLVCFAVSCWAILTEWRLLVAKPGRQVKRVSAIFLACAIFAIPATLAVLLPQRTLDLRRAPLQGADLRSFDLRGVDLRDAKLDGASLSGAMLEGAFLAGAELDNADLRGAHLDAADLAATRLNYANLSGACMVATHLANAEIEGARFNYAWLIGAELTQLQPRTRQDRTKPPEEKDIAYEKLHAITSADFTGARLCGAELGVASWMPKAITGTPNLKPGPALADTPDSNDTRFVPAEFGALKFADAAGTSDAKKSQVNHDMLVKAFPACLDQIHDEDNFLKPCPDAPTTLPKAP